MAGKGDKIAKSRIGEKHGRLTIVDVKRCDKARHYKMVCLCQCGRNTTVVYAHLKNSLVQSCGCYQADMRSENSRRQATGITRNNLALSRIGEKHGRLTIQGVEKRVGSRAYHMRCFCECGNYSSVVYAHLKSGVVKSCGCYHREAASILGSTTIIYNSTVGTRRFGWQFEHIKMRSGFEVMFAMALHQRGIVFHYEPTCFTISDNCRYTPDFYVPSEDCYYEIKGRLSERQMLKIDCLRGKGIRVKLLFQSDVEKALGKSYSSFQRQWCKDYDIAPLYP